MRRTNARRGYGCNQRTLHRIQKDIIELLLVTLSMREKGGKTKLIYETGKSKNSIYNGLFLVVAKTKVNITKNITFFITEGF